METKQSKVAAIAENQKQWAGTNGTVYYHMITFENGDSGWYGSKTEKCEKFKVGELADYTKEVKQNGNFTNTIIKPVQQQGFGKKETKDASLIAAQSCLGYACNLTAQSSKADNIEYVLQVAEKFHQWVMTKKTI